MTNQTSTIPVRLRAAEAERAKRFAYALVDRDLLLDAATEIERLEGLYLSAVNGRREMRQGLRDARAARTSAGGDPRDPDPSRPGIFRDHNCYRCKDGAQPCVNGHPNQCDYPRARND